MSFADEIHAKMRYAAMFEFWRKDSREVFTGANQGGVYAIGHLEGHDFDDKCAGVDAGRNNLFMTGDV